MMLCWGPCLERVQDQFLKAEMWNFIRLVSISIAPQTKMYDPFVLTLCFAKRMPFQDIFTFNSLLSTQWNTSGCTLLLLAHKLWKFESLNFRNIIFWCVWCTKTYVTLWRVSLCPMFVHADNCVKASLVSSGSLYVLPQKI